MKKKTGNVGELSLLNIAKGVVVSMVALALIAGIAYGVYAIQINSRDKRLAEMEQTLKVIQERLYARQSEGIYGGKTPAGTIYLYYEFLESRDFPVLSTYFIPEKRAVELSRYDGVSEKEILAFVEELRAAEILARKADSSAKTYKMTSPVNMELKKMPNDVWEFVSINRKLK